MATKKTEISAGVKMPITFKEFAKNPVTGLMFMCLVAVGYLYVDGKMSYNRQIEELKHTVEIQTQKIDLLTEQLRRSDSAFSAATAKIATLQEYGQIK